MPVAHRQGEVMDSAERNDEAPPGRAPSAVVPGQFDRRVLCQDRIWVTREAEVLALTEMSTEHLRAVHRWLRADATWLHFQAMVDALSVALVREPGEPRPGRSWRTRRPGPAWLT